MLASEPDFGGTQSPLRITRFRDLDRADSERNAEYLFSKVDTVVEHAQLHSCEHLLDAVGIPCDAGSNDADAGGSFSSAEYGIWGRMGDPTGFSADGSFRDT